MISTARISIDGIVSRFWRALVIVTALALLSSPTELRAGAEIEHPHSLLQFMANGGVDAFDHHHPGRELLDPHTRQPPTSEAAHPHALSPARELRDLAGSARLFDCLTRLSESPAVPSIDSPSAPSEQSSSIAAGFLGLPVLVTELGEPLFPDYASCPRGLSVEPELPPPQFSR